MSKKALPYAFHTSVTVVHGGEAVTYDISFYGIHANREDLNLPSVSVKLNVDPDEVLDRIGNDAEEGERLHLRHLVRVFFGVSRLEDFTCAGWCHWVCFGGELVERIRVYSSSITEDNEFEVYHVPHSAITTAKLYKMCVLESLM